MPVRLCRPKAWFVDDGLELTSAPAQQQPAAAPHSEPRSCATTQLSQGSLSLQEDINCWLLCTSPHVAPGTTQIPLAPSPRAAQTGSTATLYSRTSAYQLMWARTYSCDKTSPAGAVAQASDCSLRTAGNVRGVVGDGLEREAQLSSPTWCVLTSDIDSDTACRRRRDGVCQPQVTQPKAKGHI